MPVLIKPELYELSWRTKLHNSKNTTKNTCVKPFVQEDYASFYEHWLNADPHVRMYRYITCTNCGGTPVGECAYEVTENTCNVYLLIHADQRRLRFGTAALHLLAKEANRFHITTFQVRTDCAETEKFLKAVGFTEPEEHLFKICTDALISLQCEEEDCCP